MDSYGGIRGRLIKDSLYFMLKGCLEDLGWFTPGANFSPINFIPKALDTDERIEFNTMTLSSGNFWEAELEMGSNAAETTKTYYVDFFAEDDALGEQLITDVKAIAAGRYPLIGREHPTLEVLDYRLATPVPMFNVDIASVRVDRAQDFPKPWLKNWWSCWFHVTDEEF